MKKLGLFLVILALVSCAGDKSDKDKDKDASDKPAKAVIKTDNLICPQVAILQAAQETADYGGEKSDPAQLVAKAHMKSVEGDCAYRNGYDNKKKNGIDISFTVHMAAERGPRVGDHASFPYFIAVVDPSENILSRQIVTAQFKFSDKIAVDEEKMHIFIPLQLEEQQAGPDYRVLIGFPGATHQ